MKGQNHWKEQGKNLEADPSFPLTPPSPTDRTDKSEGWDRGDSDSHRRMHTDNAIVVKRRRGGIVNSSTTMGSMRIAPHCQPAHNDPRRVHDIWRTQRAWGGGLKAQWCEASYPSVSGTHGCGAGAPQTPTGTQRARADGSAARGGGIKDKHRTAHAHDRCIQAAHGRHTAQTQHTGRRLPAQSA